MTFESLNPRSTVEGAVELAPIDVHDLLELSSGGI